MKWILIFWICSAICKEEPISKTYYADYTRSQRVLFYDSLLEASLAQRRLMHGMKLKEFEIEENESICSPVELYKIEKEVSK